MILIGTAELLQALYTEVLIPEAVAKELQQPATPESVCHWIVHAPPWLHVVPFTASPTPLLLADLDPGEHILSASGISMKFGHSKKSALNAQRLTNPISLFLQIIVFGHMRMRFA